MNKHTIPTILSVLIAAATILTACADTPDNLLESSSNLGSDNSSEDLSAIERQISLEKLRDNKEQIVEEICDASYDNLNFQSGLSFVVPDEIGEYQVIVPDHFQDNADKLFDKYIPEDMYDESKIIDDLTTYPFGPYFEDPETGIYVVVGCTGFFSYSYNQDSSKYVFTNMDLRTSHYIPSDSSDDSSMLTEVQANAVQVAQDIADDFTSYISYPNEFDIATLAIHERVDDSDLYALYLQSLYKGLRVLNITSRYNDLSFEMSSIAGAVVLLDSESAVEDFTAEQALEEYKAMKIIDKITSPKWAARALSDELSSNLDYDVIGIDLAYVPVFIENAEKEIAGTDFHAMMPVSASYNVYELTPYWIFYFDVTPSKEVLGMVNCIDGSIEFMNNVR